MIHEYKNIKAIWNSDKQMYYITETFVVSNYKVLWKMQDSGFGYCIPIIHVISDFVTEKKLENYFS